MPVCLFEHAAESLDPIALTRPVFDLRCGLVTLGEKLRRAFRASTWSAWVRPELVEIARLAHPDIAVNQPSGNPSLWLNARWLPPDDCCIPPGGPSVGTVDGDIAWILAPAKDRTLEELLDFADDLPRVDAGGAMVRYAWDLVDRNGGEIARDVRNSNLPASHPHIANIVGDANAVFIHSAARIDPLVVLDATPGPIVIDEGAVIGAFSHIQGPCVIGPHTHVMGAKIRGGVTIGPECRIGGEVEASIIHGYTNKYHEGFLGHSYLGEWVNLGAGTHTSDLRNDYGNVDVVVNGERIPTGHGKVGCFIGDHTKTGLGSLINTGSNLGPFCNVLPAGRFAPKHMPAFTTWWNGQLKTGFPLPQLLITARKVMERRGKSLTSAHIHLYERLWDATDPLRWRVLRETEQRQARRAA